MEVKIPQCDKCGGTDFDNLCIDPIVREYISASEYFNTRTEGVPAVMVYSHYRATCKNCGAEYSYTR